MQTKRKLPKRWLVFFYVGFLCQFVLARKKMSYFILWLSRAAADSEGLAVPSLSLSTAFFTNNNTIRTLFLFSCLFSGVSKQIWTCDLCLKVLQGLLNRQNWYSFPAWHLAAVFPLIFHLLCKIPKMCKSALKFWQKCHNSGIVMPPFHNAHLKNKLKTQVIWYVFCKSLAKETVIAPDIVFWQKTKKHWK